MIDVAITGCYCSGKSTVMQILADSGYKTFSCDEYVTKLYTKPEIISDIIKELPQTKDENGNFAKHKLFDVFLTEPDSRIKLEEIIHPLVRQKIVELKNNWQDEVISFFEVPLLFETGIDKQFTKSACCYCLEDTRKKRAIKRGQDKEKGLNFFHLINSLQLSQVEKKARADILIDTEDNIANITANLFLELKKLTKEDE